MQLSQPVRSTWANNDARLAIDCRQPVGPHHCCPRATAAPASRDVFKQHRRRPEQRRRGRYGCHRHDRRHGIAAEADTLEPTQIINAQQIETRGYTNIGQALAELPAIAPGINGSGGQSSFGPGQTSVDFFGLGTQRTLTLVNGRRFVSSNTASIFGPTDSGSQVDLNIIPTNLVDRIDIVAVGGAPIYGSDAIAGTVNIILKRNYQGIELDGQYGLAARGDADNYRVRGLAGINFGGGRGNITVSGEYNRSGGLIETDRAVTARQTFFTTPPAGSPFQQIIINDRRIPSLSEQGIPFVTDFFALSPAQLATGNFGPQPTVTNTAGQALRFDASGALVPIDFGTGPSTSATGRLAGR